MTSSCERFIFSMRSETLPSFSTVTVVRSFPDLLEADFFPRTSRREILDDVKRFSRLARISNRNTHKNSSFVNIISQIRYLTIYKNIKFDKNNIKKQRNYALMLKMALQRGVKDPRIRAID